jgi:bifunctional UDP-N-acetylglucosamine pyrophosphorylase/glucosamine-1-phosphate N-acetyltransferase
VTDGKLAAIVMAAGLGTRMRSQTPKHLHPLLGRRLVDWVIDAAHGVNPDPLVVVTSPETREAIGGDGITIAIQPEARGTGDAVAAARESLEGFGGDALVLSGDSPLLTSELLERLVDAHRESRAAVTILTFEPTRPLPYGRIVRGPDGHVTAIVEEGDASEDELAISELNSSTYVFDAAELWTALDGLTPENAQGELYLTDTVRALADAGKTVATYRSDDPEAPVGINTRVELAQAAAVLRDRINERHMLAGATIVDPSATWIEPDGAPVHGAPRHDEDRPRRRGRAARRRRRRGDRRAGARGAVLLPSSRNSAGGGREGRHVRRAEELADRRRDKGAAPVLRRRRRDRRRIEPRRGQYHC